MNYDSVAFITVGAVFTIAVMLSFLFTAYTYIRGYSLHNRIVVHWTSANRIRELEKQVKRLHGQIEYVLRVQTEIEESGQIRFDVPDLDDKRDVIIPYDIAGNNGDLLRYVQIWKPVDWMRAKSDKWVWAEREYHNRKNQRGLRYLWVHEDEFDPYKDVDILSEYVPYLDYEYIYEPCKLPFKWEYIGVIQDNEKYRYITTARTS